MSQLLSSMLHSHNRSSISQKSSRYLSYNSELNDSELVKQVNELKHQVKVLTLENEIFEKTIMRVEPALMHGVQQALEYAMKLHVVNRSNTSLTVGSITKSEMTSGPSRMILSLTSSSRVNAKKRQSSYLGGTVIYGTGPRINVLERSELVSQEIQTVVMNLDKVKRKAAKDHAILQAKLEEIGIRVAGVDKAIDDFQREVIDEGWDKIAHRIPAEIWIKFMVDWMKITDKQIAKLRLRTSTLNAQYLKLSGKMRFKKELNESLLAVDFDKLEIENAACKALIEQKIQQLEQLKQMTGDANLYLTLNKNAMIVQNNYLSEVLNKIKHRKDQAVHMNKEREVITVQAESIAQKLCKIQQVRQRYEVPDVMDYVGVKSELADLKHSVKLLENRLHIAQIAVSSIAKKLHSIYFIKKKF